MADLTPVDHDPFEKDASGKDVYTADVMRRAEAGRKVWDAIQEHGPEFVENMVAPFKRLFVEGGWQKGPDDPQAKEDMTHLLTTMYAGSAFNKAEANVLNVFGGAKQKGWKPGKEDIAVRMALSGKSEAEIWADTGLFRGKEGKWRNEIPDTNAKVSNRAKPQFEELPEGESLKGKLGDMYDHPELYAAYPDLKDIDVMFTRNRWTPSGGYTKADKRFGFPELIRVSGRDIEDVRDVMTHELQHAIQNREGFSQGASPDTVAYNAPEELARTRESMDRIRNSVVLDKSYNRLMFSELGKKMGLKPDEFWPPKGTPQDQIDEWHRLGREQDSINKREAKAREDAGHFRVDPEGDTYHRTSGEVEARNAASRADFTPAQLEAQSPTSTEDVERKFQHVIKQPALEPVDHDPFQGDK